MKFQAEPQPLISVIVPVYNVEKYLNKCIESIISQTYKNIEIILVDDGSTDNSYRICASYMEIDSRVYVVQKENGGLASARNAGLEFIHGEYVSFVDSDDWIEIDTYELMLEKAIEYPDHIVLCGRYNVDEGTGEKSPLFDLPGIQIWKQQEAMQRFLTWDKIDTSVCDKLFPSKMIDELRFPSGFVSEDVPFFFAILKRAEGIAHIGACKYNYLQRKGSISHSVYSERSKGLLVYPQAIWMDICENDPSLKMEADYYCFSRVVIYLKLLYQSGKKEVEQARFLRKHLFSILRNKCFSKREKLLSVLAAFYLLGFAQRVYEKYGRIRELMR